MYVYVHSLKGISSKTFEIRHIAQACAETFEFFHTYAITEFLVVCYFNHTRLLLLTIILLKQSMPFNEI